MAFIKKYQDLFLIMLAMIFQVIVYKTDTQIFLLSISESAIVGLCITAYLAIRYLVRVEQSNRGQQSQVFWTILLGQSYGWAFYGYLTGNLPLVILNLAIMFILQKVVYNNLAIKNLVFMVSCSMAIIILNVTNQTIGFGTPLPANNTVVKGVEIISTILSALPFWWEFLNKTFSPKERQPTVWISTVSLMVSFIAWSIWAFDVGAIHAGYNNISIAVVIFLTFLIEKFSRSQPRTI